MEPIAPLPFVLEPDDDSEEEEEQERREKASPRSSFGSAWGSGSERARESIEQGGRVELSEKGVGEPIRIVPVDVGW